MRFVINAFILPGLVVCKTLCGCMHLKHQVYKKKNCLPAPGVCLFAAMSINVTKGDVKHLPINQMMPGSITYELRMMP